MDCIPIRLDKIVSFWIFRPKNLKVEEFSTRRIRKLNMNLKRCIIRASLREMEDKIDQRIETKKSFQTPYLNAQKFEHDPYDYYTKCIWGQRNLNPLNHNFSQNHENLEQKG